MSDYLVQQAVQNIWCTPTQDMQQIVKLAKITRYGGVYTKVAVMWRQYNLPVANVLFHVYQVGGISPRHLGLTMPAVAGLWLRMADVCIAEESIVDLYNLKGVQSPRSLCWYTVTEDGDLTVAVQAYNKLDINYNTEDLFMRVYHNAYFGSVRRDPAVDYIVVKGGILNSTEAILALQNQYNIYAAKGSTYAFVNGYLVNAINLLTVNVNDVAEFVYDGAIYATEEIRVGDLAVFDSELDTKRKYLVHPLAALKTTITYQDDIDVFAYLKDANGQYKGIYFHRNAPDALRQITHADYALCIAYLAAYAEDQNWPDINNVTLRIQLRKSGWRRSLVNETNRIKELYKLPDDEILAAMVGIDATVPEWQAATLEASKYTEVMRSAIVQITPAMVQQAYGYNAMSQLLAPTPQFSKNVNNQVVVDIPVNLQYRSTVFEYDFQGKLLGWYTHTNGASWLARNTNTHMVEILTGYGLTRLDERYGAQAVQLDKTLDYRMYICGIYNTLPDNNWQDVTDGHLYVVNAANTLTWLTDTHTTYTMVRSNRDFLCYNLDLPVQRGVIDFVLSSEQKRSDGFTNTLMQVAMGELDIFMNGYALVEGVDYIVNFPLVVVINKRFIDLTKVNQLITVRFCGHSQKDMTRTALGDRGFVSHGVLSNNDRFDIRDDKVLHIAIGGAVYDRSELTFAENHSGVNVPGVPNGAPYVIRDVVVPLRGTTNAKTYELRDAALVTDQHVSDYLTMKLPAPTFTELDVIPSLYPVYSPFISALIDDLKSGLFNDNRINGQYNDDVVRDMCRYYEKFLPFEPTREPNAVDLDFVSVQPYYKDTVTDLTLFQYRFLYRAVDLYLNNAASLSRFVTATV